MPGAVLNFTHIQKYSGQAGHLRSVVRASWGHYDWENQHCRCCAPAVCQALWWALGSACPLDPNKPL